MTAITIEFIANLTVNDLTVPYMTSSLRTND